MAINIYKRTRLLITDEWGAWSLTTDIPPYTNTDLIEYKAEDGSTIINISDITSNVSTDSDFIVSGDGYFDDLMETATKHLEAQAKKSYLEGDAYAKVYASVMNNIINQAMQFALTKRSAELRADGLNEDVLKKKEDYLVQTGTGVRDAKIATVISGAEKAENEASYIATQEEQLIKSVRYNNRIKALDALLDMMGTFGAGGLTFDDSQWAFMYNQMATLTSDLNDYKGEWNASTNTPDISAVTGMAQGDFYRVSTDGSTNLDGTDTWAINDIAVYVGDRWVKSDVVIPSTYNVAIVT